MPEILRNALGQQSIFYPPYLLSALVITVLWLMSAQKLTARRSLALLAPRSHWLTRSSRSDLLLWLFNLALVASALASCHDEEIGLQSLRFGLGTDDPYRHTVPSCAA